ncbi:branched chain amino acid ABC transporter substrate-binding protein [Trinickia symbiotica]|uniref:Branched chain amino acid ABC transporter substrate-binding protein n=1 Tax=Trinickia symbiotica TaxID=863227 RepID=A0A2T3XPW5_9BURK|nr:branched-chain amino acid ABC transporter substrate-binding protein [Trinickia symbiotica]PTB18553.1 branched chain amino acid ABC transporter substrate-binding protein [Trinickia symbiotica]
MRIAKTIAPIAVAVGTLLAAVPLTASADVTVKIGFAAPLTGPNANYGADLKNGVQMALDDAKAQGIKINGQTVDFQLVSEDDQADPRTGTQVAQKLVDEGVNVVIGHFNSGTTIPASVIYEKAGIPDIDPAATNPTISGRGFKNMFMVISNDAQNAGTAGTYAVEVTKAKRIAIIDDRTAFGQGEADEFAKAVKKAGGNIVGREYTTNSATDFKTQLTSLKGKNPDLIFVGALNPQAAGIMKQMRQLGMKAQYVGGGGVKDIDFIKLAGDDAENAEAWEYGRPLDSTPVGKTFADNFKKKFGVDVLSYAPFGYDATWTAIKAMQAANSAKPDDYRAKLKDISFDGITGHIAFNPDGSLKGASSTMYQVKNGQWVTVVTKSAE